MGRSPCCERANVKRGPWSPEEDCVLKNFVERFGNGGNWISLPQKAGLRRCGKSCRLRWLNYLRPALRHGGFTDDEDSLILSLYGEIGSKWSVIASKLPGRTDNDVKNYWNTKLKKRYFMPRTASPPATEFDPAMAASESISPTPPSPPPPPPPAIANLAPEGVLDAVDDELLQKSDDLYAELAGLIELCKTTTTTSCQSEEASEAASSSMSVAAERNGDSGSSTSSGGAWPVNGDAAVFLSESGFFDCFSANYCSGLSSAHAVGALTDDYSLQDFEAWLATSSYEVMQQDDQLLLY